VVKVASGCLTGLGEKSRGRKPMTHKNREKRDKMNGNPKVIAHENLIFEVESFTRPGRYYTVDLIERSCTCPHFRFRGAICKHIKLVEALVDQTKYWEW